VTPDRLAEWAVEVTEPESERDLGKLADWAVEVTEEPAA
jgi:hypothetical protein